MQAFYVNQKELNQKDKKWKRQEFYQLLSFLIAHCYSPLFNKCIFLQYLKIRGWWIELLPKLLTLSNDLADIEYQKNNAGYLF